MGKSEVQATLLIAHDCFCRCCTISGNCTIRSERQKWNINIFDCFLYTKRYTPMSYVVLYDTICFWPSQEETCQGTTILINVPLGDVPIYNQEVCKKMLYK